MLGDPINSIDPTGLYTSINRFKKAYEAADKLSSAKSGYEAAKNGENLNDKVNDPQATEREKAEAAGEFAESMIGIAVPAPPFVDTVGDNTPIDKIIDRGFDRYEAIDQYLEKEGLEGKSCD